MSNIIYGVELPTFGSGGGGGAPVDPFQFALAQENVPPATTKTIPAGFQYIRYKDFLVEGILIIEGELVVFG